MLTREEEEEPLPRVEHGPSIAALVHPILTLSPRPLAILGRRWDPYNRFLMTPRMGTTSSIRSRTVACRNSSMNSRRGVPVEQMQAEALADVDRAIAWWREAQANPARLEVLVNEACERQRARTVG
jgi:hypothetical protein